MNRYLALKNYQTTKIVTSNSLELMVFLLENTQKEIVKGRRSLDNNIVAEKNNYLNRAQLYISEMILLLDMNARSYVQYKAFLEYLNNKLICANTNNNMSDLDEVEGYIYSLIIEWGKIKKNSRE